MGGANTKSILCDVVEGKIPAWDRATPRNGDADMTAGKSPKHYPLPISARSAVTSEQLAKISLFYHGEAERCARNRAYFAACVLGTAALEALLLAMCQVEHRQARSTSVYRQKTFSSRRNRFLEFNLFQLINIAAELTWILGKEIRLHEHKATFKDLMHAVRETRNMVHPGA
jgi:hypothetical protein